MPDIFDTITLEKPQKTDIFDEVAVEPDIFDEVEVAAETMSDATPEEERPNLFVRGLKTFGRSFVNTLAAIRTESEAGKGFTELNALFEMKRRTEEAGIIPKGSNLKAFLALPQEATEDLFAGETTKEMIAKMKTKRVKETAGFKATEVPEAVTIPEKAANVVGNVAGFISKLAVTKKFIGPGTGQNLVAWETLNLAENGTPGTGAAMYIALRGIDKIPIEGTKGFFVKTASQSGLFAGVAGVAGGDTEDVVAAALIPWALRAVDLAAKTTAKAARGKLETKAVKNLRNISKDNGIDLTGVPDNTLKFLIGRSKQARFWNKQFEKGKISEDTLNKRLNIIRQDVGPVLNSIAKQQPAKPTAEKPTENGLIVKPAEPPAAKPIVPAQPPAAKPPTAPIKPQAVEGKIPKEFEPLARDARKFETASKFISELEEKVRTPHTQAERKISSAYDRFVQTKPVEQTWQEQLVDFYNLATIKKPIAKPPVTKPQAVKGEKPVDTQKKLILERRDIKKIPKKLLKPSQTERLTKIEDELVRENADLLPEIDISPKNRRVETKKVSDQITSHGIYEVELEGLQDVPDMSGTFPASKSEMEDIRARFEGRPDILKKFTEAEHGGTRIDEVSGDMGIGGFDDFLDAVEIYVDLGKAAKGAINESALAKALNSGDPVIELFALKHDMLKNEFTAAEINKEIAELADREGMDIEQIKPELIQTEDITDVDTKQAILRELDKTVSKAKKKQIPEQEKVAIAKARGIAFKTKKPVYIIEKPSGFSVVKTLPATGEFIKITPPVAGVLEGKLERLTAEPKKPKLTPEQVKEVNLLKQKINIERKKKGIGEGAFSDLKMKHGGSRRLAGARPRTIEQLQAVLKAVRRARPSVIGHKKVITRKTEKEIKELRQNLTDLEFMNDTEFQKILDIETMGKEPKFVDAKNFITQKEGHEILNRMHDTAQKLRVTEPIRIAVEKKPEIKAEIAKIDKLPKKAKDPSRLKSMRFFMQRMGEQAKQPIYDVFLDLTLEEQARSRVRHKSTKLAEALPGFAKIANSPEALQRVEDWIVSKSTLKDRPKSPEDITDEELRLAKLVQASFEAYETLARAGKFFEFFDNRAEMPQYLKFKQSIDKAFDIYNTQGYDALIKYLDKQDWGIVSAGYSPMESVVKKVSTHRMPSIAVGKGRIRQRGITYRKQERDILQRWYSYMRQMDQLVHIQPRIKSLVRLVNDSQASFVNPGRTNSVISTYLDNLKHTNYEDGLIEEWSRRLYSQAITVRVLADPLKPLRNLVQNAAFSEDRRDFLDPRNKKLTAEDLEYLETHAQQASVMMTDWAYVGEDPLFAKNLTKWVQRKTLYPTSDRVNRLISFHAKINRVRRAFAKDQALTKKMKDARFSDMQNAEQRKALEILAKDGVDAMARYIAKVHTDNTHFLYAREQRSPAEQTKVGKIALNLALFRRAALEKALFQLGKIFQRGTGFAAKRRAASVLVTLLGMSALLGIIWKKLTGQRYSPYSYFNFLELNFGGLEVATIQKAEDAYNSMLGIISLDPKEIGKGLDAFGTDISKVADYMIPFYDLGLRAIEATIGSENIDRVPLRKLREIIDKEYKSRGVRKIERSLIEKIQFTFAKGGGGKVAEETTTDLTKASFQ